MTSKHLLIELIEYLEQFETVVPNASDMDLDAFLAFVQSLQLAEMTSDKQDRDKQDIAIARHMSLLHRYSRLYIKKALQASKYIQSEEEYTYLIHLLNGAEISKTELHQRNGLEKTTGGEVIRRLRKHGLIAEKPDPNDKRSILVELTPLGRIELMKVLPNLRTAAQILSTPLQDYERSTLHQTLTRLTQRHAEVLVKYRDIELHEYLDLLEAPQKLS